MTEPTTPASNGSSTSSDLLDVEAWAPFLPEAGPALLAGLREVDRRIADLTRSLALAQEQRIEALRTIESDIARQWSSDDVEHARKAARLARDGLVDCIACDSASASEDCPACGRHPNDSSDDNVRRRIFHVSVSIYPCLTTHLELAASTADEASDLAVDEILSNPRYMVLDFNGNAVSLQVDDICINEAWEPGALPAHDDDPQASLQPSDASLLSADSLRTPDQDDCGALGPSNLHCTREAGHSGPHVAHVHDEPVAMWLPVTTE